MTTGNGVAAETGDDERSIGIHRPAWLTISRGTREGPAVDPDTLPPDDAFEILRNPRRRHAIRILSRCDGPVELSDLAREVASIENDKQPDDVSAAERKRVYISLYQCHVSKMVQAGIIRYDDEARIVELTRSGSELAEVLDSYGADSDGVSPILPAVAVVAVGVSIASFYASLIGVAMLFLGIGLSFAVFTYYSADA